MKSMFCCSNSFESPLSRDTSILFSTSRYNIATMGRSWFKYQPLSVQFYYTMLSSSLKASIKSVSKTRDEVETAPLKLYPTTTLHYKLPIIEESIFRAVYRHIGSKLVAW